MKSQNKPWLDEKGKPLSAEALKDVSKSWNSEIWEEYLQTLEEPLIEKLIDPRRYDDLAAKQDETIFKKFCISSDSGTQKHIQRLLEQLSPMERIVIEKIFYDGRSERHIATELSRSRSVIKRRKKEALARIKQLLTEGGPALPYIGGCVMNSKDAFQKIDESYQEGSLTKDQRNHLWALADLGGIKEGDLS